MRTTHRIYIGGVSGYVAIVVAALALSGVACPKPQPNPVTPGPDADAGPYVAPIRVPSAATCAAAARAAKTACSDVDEDTLADICGREDISYANRLVASRNCADVRRADPGSGDEAPGAQPARGR